MINRITLNRMRFRIILSTGSLGATAPRRRRPSPLPMMMITRWQQQSPFSHLTAGIDLSRKSNQSTIVIASQWDIQQSLGGRAHLIS